MQNIYEECPIYENKINVIIKRTLLVYIAK